VVMVLHCFILSHVFLPLEGVVALPHIVLKGAVRLGPSALACHMRLVVVGSCVLCHAAFLSRLVLVNDLVFLADGGRV